MRIQSFSILNDVDEKRRIDETLPDKDARSYKLIIQIPELISMIISLQIQISNVI